MGDDFQTAPTAREALVQWFSGRLDRCHELLLQHLNITIPTNLETTSAVATNPKERHNSGQSATSTQPSSSSSNSNAGSSNPAALNLHSSLSRLVVEQDYASLHNLLLTHYLANGQSIPWVWTELQQMRISSSSEASSAHLHRGGSASSANDSKGSPLAALTTWRPQTGQRLDPHSYPVDSIDACLAALGPVQPLAWYNLVVLQAARGHHRTALRVCDEVLEVLFSPLVELNHPLAIKLGLVFLYIIVKLNYASHPKHAQVLADVEKVLSFKLANSNGPEHLVCLEQNVWFHILRSQFSMILLRMKSSKREVSTMMGAFSKWSQSKTTPLPAPSTAASSSATATAKQTEEAALKLAAGENLVNCAMQFVKSRLLDLRNNQDKAESDLKEPYILSVAPAPFYNNLGVLAFHRRKFAVASLYFLKASQENQKARQAAASHMASDSRRHLPESILDLATDVTYNMGLQMLMLGQFEGALRCFQEVTERPSGTVACSQAMSHLRLAESQLAVYSARVAAQAGTLIRPTSPSRQQSSSTSATSSPSPSNSTSTSNEDAKTGSTKTISELFREGGHLRLQRIKSPEYDPLLEGASNSAATALLLFERFGRSGAPLAFSKGSITPLDRSQMIPRDFLVRVYTNVLLAWIALEQKNFAKAKEWAIAASTSYHELDSNTGTSTLLAGQPLTVQEKAQMDHYSFLAHLYHAEADLRLGNIDGALHILQEAPVHLSKFPLLPSTHPLGSGGPHIEAALTTGTLALGAAIPPKLALLCNMAAVYIVKKDTAQAQRLLSQALVQNPNLLPAVALQAYLEVAAGNVDIAVRLMCDFRVQDLLCIR